MDISSVGVFDSGVIVYQGSRSSKTGSVVPKDSQSLSLFRSSSNTPKEESWTSRRRRSRREGCDQAENVWKDGGVIFIEPIGENLVVRKKNKSFRLAA
jgi:hypothetical protein